MAARFEKVPARTSLALRWDRNRNALLLLLYQQLLWLYFFLRRWQP